MISLELSHSSDVEKLFAFRSAPRLWSAVYNRTTTFPPFRFIAWRKHEQCLNVAAPKEVQNSAQTSRYTVKFTPAPQPERHSSPLQPNFPKTLAPSQTSQDPSTHLRSCSHFRPHDHQPQWGRYNATASLDLVDCWCLLDSAHGVQRLQERRLERLVGNGWFWRRWVSDGLWGRDRCNLDSIRGWWYGFGWWGRYVGEGALEDEEASGVVVFVFDTWG